MESFAYQFPTRLHFGRGLVSKVGIEAAALGKNVLVLTGAESPEATTKVSALLNEAGVKVAFHTVEGNQATLSEAAKAAKAGRDAMANAIVALGGNVVLDLARLTAFGLYDPDRIWDQFPKVGEERTLERTVPICAVMLQPPCALPSFSGGALTNTDTGERHQFRHDSLFPRVAILDPELTYTASKDATVDSACEIIGRLLDGYFNGTDNTPVQDRLAINLIETIMENLPVIQSNPANFTARANLLWVGMMASSGLPAAGRAGNTPLTHLARTLAGMHNISPGKAFATLLPAFMLSVYQENPEPFARFGHQVFGLPIMSPTMEEAAHKGILQFRKWLHKNNWLWTLTSAGVPKDELEALGTAYAKLASDGHLQGLVEFDADRVQALIQHANQ